MTALPPIEERLSYLKETKANLIIELAANDQEIQRLDERSKRLSKQILGFQQEIEYIERSREV